MDLDLQAVGAADDRREAHGLDHEEYAGAVRGVHEDGQVALGVHRGDHAEVEGVARIGFEGAYAPLAEYDLVVSLREYVLGAVEPFLEGGVHASLEEDGLAGLARLAEQREVLHVASAYLEDIGVLADPGDVARVDDLGYDGQARLFLGLVEDLEALEAQALEGVGRGARLEGPAAQHLGSGVTDGHGRPYRLLLGLDGARARDDDELLADADAADLYDAPGPARLLTGKL